MRIWAAIAAACLLASCSAPADVVISNVTAIDATGGVRSGVDVVIQDGKIIAAEAGAAAEYNADVVVEGDGQYLIPGLWDAHVHLSYEPGVDHSVFFPLGLAYGVTSLRDIGGHLYNLQEARQIAASGALVPDLYVSGPLLDGAPSVYIGQSPRTPAMAETVRTPEEAVAVVERLAGEGVQFLKAYEMLRPDTFEAINTAADVFGLRVAAHVPLSMTAQEAALAGADDFQHLRNLELACAAPADRLHSERLFILASAAPDADGSALRSKIHAAQRPGALAVQDEERCGALVELLEREAVFQTPTMTILTLLTRRLFADEDYRATFDQMPSDIAASWRKRSSMLLDRSPSDDALIYEAWAKQMVRQLAQGGVTIMAGTDAPIGWLVPGRSLHEELSLLVDAGLSEMEVLKAATLTPAQFFGLEDRQGAIAAGQIADLVLLEANPLDDIRNTQRINAVVKRGTVLDRAALDALLASVGQRS